MLKPPFHLKGPFPKEMKILDNFTEFSIKEKKFTIFEKSHINLLYSIFGI